MWSKPFIEVALIFSLLRLCDAQQPSAPRVRVQVEKIAIGGSLTVKMIDGRELHGRLSRIEAATFAIREVDLKQTVTVQYSEVDRVTRGYGRRGFIGHRVSPQHRLLISVLVIGGLLALVFIAAASDKS